MVFAAGGHRTREFAGRAALAVASLILLGTSAWFAASWIDTGDDSTCGAVIHPDIWLDDSTPSSCEGVMTIRATIGAATIAAGGALLYLAFRRRPVTPALAVTAMTVAVVASAAILVINELVRSDGAL
jgi:hypothetical protein